MKCGKRLNLICLVLLAASLSLWAFPGRGEEEAVIAPSLTVMTTVPMQEAESQKITSGTPSENTSVEQSGSQTNSLERAVEITESGSLLIGSKYDELLFNLTEAQKEVKAAKEASVAKDEEIATLKDDLAKAESETGTKAYVMLDGILGFSENSPDYGVGLTLGTRLGNSLMVELGTDFMLGGTLSDMLDFGMDDVTFRAGIGWLF